MPPEIDWEALSRASYEAYSKPNGDGTRPHASVRRLNELRAVVAALEQQGMAVVSRDDLNLFFDYLDCADVAEAGCDPPLWPEPPVVAAKHRLDAALAPTPEEE